MNNNKITLLERLLRKRYSEMTPADLSRIRLALSLIFIVIPSIPWWFLWFLNRRQTIFIPLIPTLLCGIFIYLFYPVIMAEKIGTPKPWEKKIFVYFRYFINFSSLSIITFSWIAYNNKVVSLSIANVISVLFILFAVGFWWGTRVFLKKCSACEIDKKDKKDI